MHAIFVREHNTVCDMLAEAHPDWDDDRLFHTARLVIAALIAKIHTIEWTPSLLNNPLLRYGMRANWFGLLGESIRKRFGRLSKSDILCGILGSPTDHDGVRYAMTEEFVAVYRMHPLMPDDFAFRDAKTGAALGSYSLTDVAGRGARQVIDTIGIENALYYLGTANPGALELKNYPNALRDLRTQEAKPFTVDLAALDIFRDRERGVPRYNQFRALLDMPRIERFEDLTPDAELAKEIEALYGDIDKVDTLIGCLAETPPPGFAFSDTAFRIFILMASRRLKSDRFFTRDFTPEIYSQEGFDWVMNTSFTDVLTRHFPEIAAAIVPGTSPFFPWTGRVG
jgi:Animal haem peroxidase